MQQTFDITTQPGVPLVSIIAAMTRDRVIGTGHTLPWYLPDDLRLFRRLTMGCTVIMGHRTYLSIGHPLPGRHNIVLSRSQRELPGVRICNNFMAGLTAAAQLGHQLFVIGGEELYRKSLPIASELHISWVKAAVQGDRYFPEFDLADWTPCTTEDHPGFCYRHYRRKTGSEISDCSDFYPSTVQTHIEEV